MSLIHECPLDNFKKNVSNAISVTKIKTKCLCVCVIFISQLNVLFSFISKWVALILKYDTNLDYINNIINQ